jgi:hypothetical protein
MSWVEESGSIDPKAMKELKSVPSSSIHVCCGREMDTLLPLEELESNNELTSERICQCKICGKFSEQETANIDHELIKHT